MIKAIIFDMDGVIIDSETICDKTWIMVAKEYGLDNISKVMELCLGTNKNDTYEIMRKVYGKDFPAEVFLARTSELFHEIEKTSGIPFMPYAKECLEVLKQQGKYRIALASSAYKATVERELGELKVLEYFEKLTTGDMVEHSKPNPEIYLLACKSLGLQPEECIAVEDSPNGIKSAFAAGMKPVMIPDKIKPTEEISKLCWRIFPSLKEFADEFSHC